MHGRLEFLHLGGAGFGAGLGVDALRLEEEVEVLGFAFEETGQGHEQALE